MKNLPQKSTERGFTLVELLVVIAIIAVLAAAGFAGGSAAMNKARKLSAQSVATSIATAVEQFYTEYSALPEPTGDAGTRPAGVSSTGLSTAGTGSKGVDVLNILAAQETVTPPQTPQNTRKIRFFSAKGAKGTPPNARDGSTYVSNSSNVFTGLYDPWGQPFFIELDDDYDDVLTFTPYTGITEVKLRGRKVAVYSLGVPKGDKSNSSKIAKSW